MNDLDELLSGVYSATTSEIRILVRQLEVRIGILTRPVSITVWYDARSAEPYEFELSATMNALLHAARPSRGTATSEAEAIRYAVRMLTQDYEDAVRQGKMPDDNWLVPASR